MRQKINSYNLQQQCETKYETTYEQKCETKYETEYDTQCETKVLISYLYENALYQIHIFFHTV